MVDAEAHLRVVWALRRAFGAVEADKERRLRDVGLPSAHYGVLMNLGRAPGITGAELARRLAVTPQNVAVLVARLEAQGLVERRTHARHGHVRELHLTAAGESALEASDQVVSALESDVVARLGVQDAATLRDLLERLVRP